MPARIQALDVAETRIALDYARGATLIELASSYGVSHETIRQRLIKLGAKRRGRAEHRPGRAGPLHWCGKRGRGHLATYDRSGRLQYVHRVCWETHNGPVPSGHVIHHIDGDRANSDIDNLQCVSRAEHIVIHMAGSRWKR